MRHVLHDPHFALQMIRILFFDHRECEMHVLLGQIVSVLLFETEQFENRFALALHVAYLGKDFQHFLVLKLVISKRTTCGVLVPVPPSSYAYATQIALHISKEELEYYYYAVHRVTSREECMRAVIEGDENVEMTTTPRMMLMQADSTRCNTISPQSPQNPGLSSGINLLYVKYVQALPVSYSACLAPPAPSCWRPWCPERHRKTTPRIAFRNQPSLSAAFANYGL